MTTSSKAGTVLALLLCGAGCTEFLSGPGLTENPNNPLEVTALQQLIAMQSNMATRLEGQIARCAGIYTQQLIGSNNQTDPTQIGQPQPPLGFRDIYRSLTRPEKK